MSTCGQNGCTFSLLLEFLRLQLRSSVRISLVVLLLAYRNLALVECKAGNYVEAETI